jgi:hypothetical protein
MATAHAIDRRTDAKVIDVHNTTDHYAHTLNGCTGSSAPAAW